MNHTHYPITVDRNGFQIETTAIVGCIAVALPNIFPGFCQPNEGIFRVQYCNGKHVNGHVNGTCYDQPSISLGLYMDQASGRGTAEVTGC